MSAMATATFCLPLAFFSSIPLWVAIPASVLLYSGSLVLFKEIRTNEVRTLMDFLQGAFGSTVLTGPWTSQKGPFDKPSE